MYWKWIAYEQDLSKKTSRFHDRIRIKVTRTKNVIDKNKTGSDKTKLKMIRTRWEVTRTSQFPGERSHSWGQESGSVGEISNMFDILPTQLDKPGNYN